MFWGESNHYPVMSFSDRENSVFCMFHSLEAQKYFGQIKKRELQPRDFLVLFAMMSVCDTKTGKIKFAVQSLAEEIGMNKTTFSNSIKRLKVNLIIAFILEENGEKYYIINPYLVSVGGKGKWAFTLKKFAKVFE